jgi:hypothetical protein
MAKNTSLGQLITPREQNEADCLLSFDDLLLFDSSFLVYKNYYLLPASGQN